MNNEYPTIDGHDTGMFETPNLTGTPERRLLLAILERAMLDYVGNEDREVEEATEWIFGEYGSAPYDEFSFPWICEALDLDTKEILQRIKAMPRRGNNRLAPWYLTKQRVVSQKTDL